MKLIDQFEREVGVGDSIVLKDQQVQNWRIASIEDTGVSPNPNLPPLVKVRVVCELNMAFPDMGQPTQPLPMFIVRKADDAPQPKSKLAVM